jgi:hypothetical protein
MAFDDAELRALSASMLERGCLVPVLVQATAGGTYRLVDVTLVLDCGEVCDGDPWTWRDVAKDPLEVVAGGLHEEIVAAPAGVFVSSQCYALSAFSLDDKRQAAAAELAELRDITVDELELCWDHAAIEQARKLNAAYTPQHGWVTLIVGQDVADTIAGDQILVALTAARADNEHAQDASSAASPDTATGAAATTSADEVVDEQASRERARAERAAAVAARERAALFNEQLGVAIVNSLSRVKVDDRVVKILTAINLASDLDRVAMRGARYGFPGWVSIEETKRGAKRRYIDQRDTAQTKAAEYLAGAKTAGELAGRTLAMVVMAVYADENAVANSNQAFHDISVQTALPWAGEVGELIDELAADKLPAALMDPVLEPRRADRAERRAAAAAQAAATQRIAELLGDGELDAQALDELEQLSPLAYGEYSTQAWELREKIRARRTALNAADTGEAPSDAPPPDVDEHERDDTDAGEHLDTDEHLVQDSEDVEGGGE